MFSLHIERPSYFFFAPKIIKIISASPQIPQNLSHLFLKCIFSFHWIKFTYLKTMKLCMSGRLNSHLTFCDIHEKTEYMIYNCFNEIHDIKLKV